MKAVTLICLLGFTLGAQECVKYVCGDLDDGVCARLSDDGNVVTINENGCPSGEYCSVLVASVYLGLGTGDTYGCDEDYDEESEDDVDIDWSDFSGEDWKNSILCDSDSDKNLKSGSWDDECETNSDCELSDGTFAECECHVNGKAYCTPDLESDYFEEWHDLCEAGDANEVYYTYFYNKAVFYTLVEHIDSDLDCATDVAVEYEAWDEVESDYEDEIAEDVVDDTGIEIDSGNQDGDDDSASSLIVGSLMAILLLA